MLPRHRPPTRPDVRIELTTHVMRRLIERWDKWRMQWAITFMSREELQGLLGLLNASGELPLAAIMRAIAEQGPVFDRPNRVPGTFHRYFSLQTESGLRHGEIVYSLTRPETENSPGEIVVTTILPPKAQSYHK